MCCGSRPDFYLTMTRGVRLTCKQAAATLAATRRGWEIRSAGHGAKGQRWYAWAWLATASPRHYLLIRRHLATGELAFHSWQETASVRSGSRGAVTAALPSNLLDACQIVKLV